MALKVFISYSQDSSSHGRRVLDYVQQLRAAGLDCDLDQFHSSPKEGWPNWMVRGIANAKRVLIVCTESYLQKMLGNWPSDSGQGVRWESLITYNDLYNSDSKNTKFIPIIFCERDKQFIPSPLRGFTHIRADKNDAVEATIRLVRNIAPATRLPLGKELPPKAPSPLFYHPSH